MVITNPSLFQSPRGLQQKHAQVVVAALMASDQKAACAENPRVLAPEAEGGTGPVPPQRDKQPFKYNLGNNLSAADQIKIMAILDKNKDRFAFSLEDIEPFTGEPMRIDLNSTYQFSDHLISWGR